MVPATHTGIDTAIDQGQMPTQQSPCAVARLLHPRSMAVFGGQAAAEVIRQCRKLGFTGALWPVHPSKKDVEGLPCFASVADLPGAPDAAFVAVPSAATVEVVRQLAQRGAGGAICYASGFAEVGSEGARLQEELVLAAGSMALVGPNCYGLLNYLDGVALWPDQHGAERVARGVAIITQSGNIGLNLTMQRRALPLAYLITVGNQAGTGMVALIDTLLDDPRVSAIGLHIEALDDVAAFSRVALKARDKRVPLVALKAGSSEAGARTTMSHTSSLAGSDALYSALFERFGVARVADVAELLETLKLLHVLGPLPGRRITSASCSGGEASLVADLAQAHGLQMPAFAPATQTALEDLLGSKVTVANPLDYHTYIWGDAQASTACFTALLQSGLDAHVLVLDFPRADRCDATSWHTTLDAFVAAQRNTGARAIVLASLPEDLPEGTAQALMAQGIAPMQGTADCMRALGAAARIGEVWSSNAPLRALESPLPATAASKSSDDRGTTELADAPPPQARVLNEVRSKQALAAFGLPVPPGQVCSGARAQTQAAACATQLGFPVVVKAVSDALAHKTEAGAVRLNLTSPQAVQQAVADMAHWSDTFLVEQMAQGAVAELLVGVQRDPLFGLTLTLAAGGILVELLQDSRSLLLPTDRAQVHAALEALRCYPLLCGFRGRPMGDVDAAVDAILAVAAYASAHSEKLLELDVNPLLVLPQGRGVLAVDALIRQLQ